MLFSKQFDIHKPQTWTVDNIPLAPMIINGKEIYNADTYRPMTTVEFCTAALTIINFLSRKKNLSKKEKEHIVETLLEKLEGHNTRLSELVKETKHPKPTATPTQKKYEFKFTLAISTICKNCTDEQKQFIAKTYTEWKNAGKRDYEIKQELFIKRIPVDYDFLFLLINCCSVKEEKEIMLEYYEQYEGWDETIFDNEPYLDHHPKLKKQIIDEFCTREGY